jgi:hypothetical protein
MRRNGRITIFWIRTAGQNPGKTALFWNTYNSVDLSGIVAGLRWKALPEPFWQFFTGSMADPSFP